MLSEKSIRKPVDGMALSIMVVLCLIWGLQQTAIKAVAEDMPPLLQVGLRSGASALLVWLFARFFSKDRWLRGVAWGPGVVVGVLFAAEFLFVAEGLRWTTASHMAVFLYTSPMFAALGLHLKLPDERLTRMQWGGILLAFVGIVITFLGPDSQNRATDSSSNWLLGDLMGLCAGAAWGATTVVVRTTRLSEAPATQTLFYQLLGGLIILLPLAGLTGQFRCNATGLVWASLGFQILIVTFASFLVWFWMLRRYLAARLGVLSFMTPFFGISIGALLLNEPLDANFLAGSALVLGGMLIVNGRSLFGKKASMTSEGKTPLPLKK